MARPSATWDAHRCDVCGTSHTLFAVAQCHCRLATNGTCRSVCGVAPRAAVAASTAAAGRAGLKSHTGSTHFAGRPLKNSWRARATCNHTITVQPSYTWQAGARAGRQRCKSGSWVLRWNVVECRQGCTAGPHKASGVQKRAFRLMIVKMIAQMPQMMPMAAAGTTISTCVVSCRHGRVQTGTRLGTPAGTPCKQAALHAGSHASAPHASGTAAAACADWFMFEQLSSPGF